MIKLPPLKWKTIIISFDQKQNIFLNEVGYILTFVRMAQIRFLFSSLMRMTHHKKQNKTKTTKIHFCF